MRVRAALIRGIDRNRPCRKVNVREVFRVNAEDDQCPSTDDFRVDAESTLVSGVELAGRSYGRRICAVCSTSAYR